jgi:hypothetical protein
LIESRSTGSHEHARWFSKEPVAPWHYLIVGYGSKGLELPHIFSDSGEEILPVFSSEAAAREYLSLSSLQERWYVRGFSGGELISLLFAFSARLKGVLLDPQSGDLSGDVAASVVGRNAFVRVLLDS